MKWGIFKKIIIILFLISVCFLCGSRNLRAGEYLIKPDTNTLILPVGNLDYSIDKVQVKVKVLEEPDWFTIVPKELVTGEIGPGEIKELIFTLYAECSVATLQKISGEAKFSYECLTEGVVEPVRERTHTFIIDKSILFVANRSIGSTGAGDITVVNLDQCGNVGKSLGSIPAGKNPFGVAVRSDGRQVYVTNSGDGTLSVIDLNFDPDDPNPTFENAEEKKINLGSGFSPQLIAITPDNSRAYIADKFGGSIKVVNLMYWTYFDGGYASEGDVYEPYEFIQDIPYKDACFVASDSRIRGNLIEAMAIDPSGRRLWVVIRNGNNYNAAGGCVAVVDIEQVVLRHSSWPEFHDIIDVIDLQPSELCASSGSHECPLNEPSGIAFTPDGDLAYITGEGTTRLIHEILNWRDVSGGVIVLDPQAVNDPSINNTGMDPFVDYIKAHVLGSKAELYFFRPARVDYSPFMGLGGGAGAGAFFALQYSYNWLASMFDTTIYKFPVDIDGAESIAITPDGKRAYVTFFNTANFGIIDLYPSEDPLGFWSGNPPPNNDIYAASEAILPSLDPLAQNPVGWDRAPNEITISKDGRYIIISNRNINQDLVTLVDDVQWENILELLDKSELQCADRHSPNNYYVCGSRTVLSRNDLSEFPVDYLPTNYSYDEAFVSYVGGGAGTLDDPEGIVTGPSYDFDRDKAEGGASDLVEAKNRFNSLLKLQEGLSAQDLISADASSLLNPSIKNDYDYRKVSYGDGNPYGDLFNNYEAGYFEDTEPGDLRKGVLLPTEGLGYRHEFGSDPYNSNNAGTITLINVLEDIGKKWFLRHPEGPRIVYLDLSRPGGGQFRSLDGDNKQRHAAHQTGLDVNVRYIWKDRYTDYPSENPFDFVLSNVTDHERDNSIEEDFSYYDHVLTTELINLFLDDERVDRVMVDPRPIERAVTAKLDFSTSEKLVIRGDLADPNSRRDYDDHFGVRIIGHENFPPVADAGRDQTILEGETFTLNGSSSFDPKGKQEYLKYLWTQKDGPSAGLTEEMSSKIIVDLSCPENKDPAKEHKSMVFGLTVFDGEFESQEDQVIIIINRKPVADSGDDQTVQAGDFVQLDGSASSDPDGDLINYKWTQTGDVTIEDFEDEKVDPSFVAPEEETVLTFELVVNDGYVKSDTDSVVITVKPPPDE